MTLGRPGKWRIGWTFSALFVVIGLAVTGVRAEDIPGPGPLASLDDRGVSLPPVGRSLFDFLVAKQVDGEWVYDVPFPFEALVEHLKAGLRDDYRGPIKAVLHPVGRSLHRHTAAPDYFRYPRAVIAVDSDYEPVAGQSGVMIKDRLYLGYQPLSESIELIAYNEAAGRFEYQVVTDYREGGSPNVTYADRDLCVSCHHNQSVIYAGGPWAESNNNPEINALLREEADSFYGLPAGVSFDIPELIDEATDRANLFSAYQLGWQEGCQAAGDFAAAVACRRDGLISVLRYRLTSRYQLIDTGDGVRDRFAHAITEGWLSRYPDGVAIPTANLPDRDPFVRAGYVAGEPALDQERVRLAHLGSDGLIQFDGAYEPLNERPPRAIWRVAAPIWGLALYPPNWIREVIGGLGDFLADIDIARLSGHLAAGAEPVRELSFPCRVTPSTADAFKFWFRCDGALGERAELKGWLRGNGEGGLDGVLDRLLPDNSVAAAVTAGLHVRDGTLERTEAGWRARFTFRDSVTGLHARMGDGNLVSSLVLDWPSGGAVGQPGEATLTVSVADDFATVVAAVDALAEATLAGDSDALAYAPFRRVAVLRPIFDQLGLASLDWCCLDAGHLPPPVLHDDAD